MTLYLCRCMRRVLEAYSDRVYIRSRMRVEDGAERDTVRIKVGTRGPNELLVVYCPMCGKKIDDGMYPYPVKSKASPKVD